MRGDMELEFGGAAAQVQAVLVRLLVLAAHPIKGRGVRRATRAFSRLFDDRNAVVVGISKRGRVVVPLADSYWINLLNPRFVYEPEVEHYLRRTLTPSSYFIDCGANIGYWPLRLGELAYEVVAVEANPATVRRLERNLELSDFTHIQVVNAAVWNTDGDTLELLSTPSHHANASVAHGPAQEIAAATSTAVTTTTLDSLIARWCPDEGRELVVKLDIEGAEVAALDGARSVLAARHATVIFEDHGSDETCAVSRHVLSIGMSIFDLVTDSPLSIAEIAARKHEAWKGYNFLARYAPN